MATPTRTAPSTPRSPRSIKRLDGLFKEGVWCCNCEQRPQAIRLQVKKESKNRGRWFYKCQKRPGCDFFLWDDDAQVREKKVVLANDTSEIDTRLQTPTRTHTPTRPKQQSLIGLLTPQTDRKGSDTTPRAQFKSPPMSAKARMMKEDTENFGWDDSDDEEFVEATTGLTDGDSFLSQPNFYPESPSKVPRTPKTSSPGKRKLADYAFEKPISNTVSQSTSSSFPSQFPPSSAELCLTPTPTKYQNVLSSDTRPDSSSLANDVLGILDRLTVVLPNNARDEIVERLNREDMTSRGLVRSRNILRDLMAKKDNEIKKKDQEILQLKERNMNLKAQVELRNTAAHLR